jgi:hypothetical protein
MKLRGKALAIGLVLWARCGLFGRRTIPFYLSQAMMMHVKEQAARRALRALEADGLVAIQHIRGHGLEVTILDVESQSSSEGGKV